MCDILHISPSSPLDSVDRVGYAASPPRRRVKTMERRLFDPDTKLVLVDGGNGGTRPGIE